MKKRLGVVVADDIDIAVLWGAVRARGKWLLGLIAAAGVGTFAALSFVTPQYSSEARILIDREESVYTRPSVGERRLEPVRVDKEIVTSQVQVLKSRDLKLDVAKALGLEKKREFNFALDGGSTLYRVFSALGFIDSSDPLYEGENVVRAFDKKLSVYAIADSHVIVVRFTSIDAQLAALAANLLSDTYVDWQRQAKLKANKGASEWLAKEIKRLSVRVQETEAAAEQFRAKTGLQAGRDNITLNVQELSELNSQLILAKAQRSEVEARAKLIQRMLNRGDDINTSSDVLRSALIQRLFEQRVQVQRLKAELSATLKSGHPRIQQLNSELGSLIRQTREEARKIALSLSNEAEVASAREASLRQSLNALKSESAGLSEETIKLRALEREAKANRKLLESYLARYRDASARQDSASVPANATIISRAFASSTPSYPKKASISALMMAATACAALAFIVTRELMGGQNMPLVPFESETSANEERWNPIVESPLFEEDEEHSDGDRFSVQMTKKKLKDGAVGPASAISAKARSEIPSVLNSLASVAQHLIECAEKGSGHRILVTGGETNVDASLEALELSRLVAAVGHDVVIMDASEGSRSLSGELSLPRSPGLSELLADEANFEDIVRRDPRSQAHFIPSGKPRADKESVEALYNIARVLDALDRTYDFIFVHAEYHVARKIFQDVDAAFDSGVLVYEKEQPGPSGDPDEPNFLGFRVAGLDITHFQRKEEDGSLGTSGEPLKRVAASMRRT